jgi:hypothetical protein
MKNSFLLVLLTLAGLACTQTEQAEEQAFLLEKIANSQVYAKLYQAQSTMLTGLAADQYDLEKIGILLKSKVNRDVCDWTPSELNGIRGAAEYQSHTCQLRTAETKLKAAFPDFFKSAKANDWQDLQRSYELQYGRSLNQKLLEVIRHKN